MKEKLSFYRPAAAAFLVMMAMALTSSTISFFLEPVCESLQISRGSFSLIFSLMSVSGALANPFVGQYAGKKADGQIEVIKNAQEEGKITAIAGATITSKGVAKGVNIAAQCVSEYITK